MFSSVNIDKMAKLSSEIKINIRNLQEQLLEIVDDARATEFAIMEGFGETDATLTALDELTEIAQQAADLYSQLATLRLRVAEAQPIIAPDMLGLLADRVTTIENRIPALERSTQEIKIDWGL